MSEPVDYEKLIRSLRVYALRYTRKVGKPHLWDDATGAALLAAVEARLQYDPTEGMTEASFLYSKGCFGVKDWFRETELGTVPGAHIGRWTLRNGTHPEFSFPVASLSDRVRHTNGEAGDPLSAVIAHPRSNFLPELERKSLLFSLLKKLRKRDREILLLHYFEELTMREIGESIGISESRVCQLHTRALNFLAPYLKESSELGRRRTNNTKRPKRGFRMKKSPLTRKE